MILRPIKDNINVDKTEDVYYNAEITFQTHFVELNKKIYWI